MIDISDLFESMDDPGDLDASEVESSEELARGVEDDLLKMETMDADDLDTMESEFHGGDPGDQGLQLSADAVAGSDAEISSTNMIIEASHPGIGSEWILIEEDLDSYTVTYVIWEDYLSEFYVAGPADMIDPFGPLSAVAGSSIGATIIDDTVIYGSPGEDMAIFSEQDAPNSCVLATTSMMFNSIGIPLGEDVLTDIFESCYAYDPSSGTLIFAIDDVINVIADVGELEVTATEAKNFTMSDLEGWLDDGSRPLVCVDGTELYSEDARLHENGGVPDAPHAVLVTGVVHGPEGDFVVINDPGFEDGDGMMIEQSAFLDAAEDFENTAVYLA